jgi:hypothetical protein
MTMLVQSGSINIPHVPRSSNRTGITQSNAWCSIYSKCASVCHTVPQRQTLNSKFYADFLEYLLKPSLIRNAHSYWLSSRSCLMARAHVTWHRSPKTSCSVGSGRCWNVLHALPTYICMIMTFRGITMRTKNSGHKKILNILQSNL